MNSNVWYKKLGFYNNPFSIKPAAYHDSLQGLGSTVDDITYAILTKKLIFVEGDYGQGKTTILKKLINDFGGKKQVAYFSCNRLDGRLDIQRLLKTRYGFLGRLLDLKAKDMILLLDEAQYLGNEDYKNLSEHHKTGSLKSIVFVSSKLNGNANEIPSDALVVNLKKINQTEAVKVIRQRVGHLHLLSDDMISKTFERSNHNIRELLKNCEKLCRYAVDNCMTKVTEEMLGEIEEIGEQTDQQKTEKTQTQKTAKAMAKKPAKRPAATKARRAPAKREEQEEAPEAEEESELEETTAEEPAEEDTIKSDLGLKDEEDELDRQVKEMSMNDDDIEDAEEEPKRRKKTEPMPKLEPEEGLLNEEDYY